MTMATFVTGPLPQVAAVEVDEPDARLTALSRDGASLLDALSEQAAAAIDRASLTREMVSARSAAMPSSGTRRSSW